MTIKSPHLFLVIFFTLLPLIGCSQQSYRPTHSKPVHNLTEPTESSVETSGQTLALNLHAIDGLEQIVAALVESQVVYIGEQHDNYGHHLAQLDIIKRLYARNPSIAIGMEMFQRPFQQALDRYIGGEISEQEMLRQTEWYDRWRFDFRLYQQILQFAREQGIPVIALNIRGEITRKIADGGIASLDQTSRQRLPDQIDKSDKAYERRLRQIFNYHPNRDQRRFDYFVESQLVWDETMASTAAGYLQKDPGRQLIVLAGSGHLMYGSGIPNRVGRRLQLKRTIILPGDSQAIDAKVADYLIYPPKRRLAQRGLLGLIMKPEETGVWVDSVLPGKGAAKAGVSAGDLLLAINGQPIKTATDLRLQMYDHSPGEQVQVTVRRKRLLWGSDDLTLQVQLTP